MGITIMTEPLSKYYRMRTVVRKYVRRIPNNYGGHYSVTRSLFNGFDKIGYKDYNYRPSLKNIHEHVHVLSGISALKYAIKLKEKKYIKRITAGPNIIGFPDSNGWKYLIDKNIDTVLFPSQNTLDYFCYHIPALRRKAKVFASGIDENDFYPEDIKRDSVLLYLKNVDPYWGDYITHILHKYKYNSFIIRYGDYKLNEYKQLLNRSLFMISLSKHDTQGLYLAEAWAMDCPTICWNSKFCSFPTSKTIIEGEQLGSPYVCKENGKMFATINDLEKILYNYDKERRFCHPRKWFLHTMTDAICSQNFLRLVN